MKHDYTDAELLEAFDKSEPWKLGVYKGLRAFLEALPTRSAQPERPQAAEIANLKAALAESEKQFQVKVDEIASLLAERDKAQGILKACLSAMPFGNIETHTVENLPGRIADLASEISAVSSENERLEAALRQSTQSAQPILADDGRSLGQVAFDAGNAVQKIKFPKQEIKTWEESAEFHDMLEAAAQAVVAAARPAIEAECLAQAVRRMEAVPDDELSAIIILTPGGFKESARAVRSPLIAAAKGEGQAQEVPQVALDPYAELKSAQAEGKIIEVFVKDDEYGPDRWSKKENNTWTLPPESYRIKPEAQPVVVNEPPKSEEQPDSSGESEKQDPYARLKAYAKAGARIRCCGLSWRADEIWVWDYPVDCYEVHPDDLHMVPEYAPQAEPATKEAPATFEAHGYTWTRHTPGDPMPCDREANVCVTFRDGDYSKPGLAKYWSWDKSLSDDEWIIGWRYTDPADQPKAELEIVIVSANEQAQPTTYPSWTPVVGDTVRLKSGGPVMTVHHIAKDGSIACTHNINGAFEFATLPAACLTPAKP